LYKDYALLGLVVGLAVYLADTLGVAQALALNLLILAWALLLLRIYTQLLEERMFSEKRGKKREGA